ncbi:death domain-containing protein CRADD-like isoform X2 [Ruditapes philippinarum]|uniref:death domain-containing protein CRADD-like isoform X2 n=1 Tax=Ruditapes philippinarum TaxID=129788 RepID=UPI00295B7311|nr:death domain-containing protein CRADD-like isoform X2 [Ruditapes philippinarum]
MPLTSGKMLLDHERKIKKNLLALKKDMDARDLTDFFIQEEIFDFPDIDKINGYNPNTTDNRNNCFFQLLFQSGERAYDVFLRALRQNQQDYLADLIENTQVNDGQAQATEPFSWIYTIPQNVRSRRLTEKDISRLAQTLGSDWQFVAYDLGLSKVDVDHCIMGYPTPLMQIYSALQKWRVRQPSLCTLDHFVKVVKDCQATSVDSGAMYEIAKNM